MTDKGPARDGPVGARRRDPAASRAMILNAVGRVMRGHGYAAVSTRRVAAEAGLKAPLVHYYYPTTDDLLLAFYCRAADATQARLEAALASPAPLRALWEMEVDPERTALAAEYLALANHRPAIRGEIARRVETFRALQAPLLARIGGCPPDGAALLLAGIARGLVMEAGIGISAGHAEARAFVEAWIAQAEPGPAI